MAVSWSYALSSGGGNISIAGPDVPSGVLQAVALALNPTTGDLAIPLQLLRGAEAVLQRIAIRFRFVRGEWFLDQRLGVPYFQDILVKNPDRRLIQEIFRTVLRTTPGVKRVESFTAALERATRILTVTFVAVLDDGSVITAADVPFIVGSQIPQG